MTATIEKEEVGSTAAAEPPSRTIYERMVAILAELPAIGKGDFNVQQKFHFRSHDAVLNALNPLLAKHGVFVVPQVVDRVTSHRQTRSGGIMYEVNLCVEYTFYGADGDSIRASAWGEGTDSGDKATNKAMTMAFKNVLAQSFAISTAETIDTDANTDEQTVRHTQGDAFMWERPQTLAEIVDRFSALGAGRDEWINHWFPQAIQILFGEDKRGTSDLSADDRNLLGQKLSSVLYELETADVTFIDRTLVQAAFAKVTNGAVPEGPPWRMSPQENDLPTAEEWATRGPETAAEDEIDRLAEEAFHDPDRRRQRARGGESSTKSDGKKETNETKKGEARADSSSSSGSTGGGTDVAPGTAAQSGDQGDGGDAGAGS